MLPLFVLTVILAISPALSAPIPETSLLARSDNSLALSGPTALAVLATPGADGISTEAIKKKGAKGKKAKGKGVKAKKGKKGKKAGAKGAKKGKKQGNKVSHTLNGHSQLILNYCLYRPPLLRVVSKTRKMAYSQSGSWEM